MMKITGGIDQGSTGTREVYLESHWKNVKVVESSKQATLVGSVPSQALTFRRFALPFTDRKRIREIVKEELTDTLAFPLDETQWDFSTGANGDTLVVGMKEAADSFPRPCEILDAEPYGLVRTALYCNFRDSLIIDFGASKTVFSAVRDGALESVKVLLCGGETLTGQLSLARNLSISQADRLKTEKGMQLPEIREGIIKLIRTANLPSPFPYPRIILTGGGAQMEGLSGFLEENLKTPVSTFALPGDVSPYSHAVAFGMALKGNKDFHGGVNLAEQKKQETNPLLMWCAAFLVPLIIFTVNLKIRETNLGLAVKKYHQEMIEVYKKEFPGEGKVVSPVKQFKARLDEKKSLMQNKAENELSVIDNIARVVEKKDIRIYEIDLSNREITLSGETASYQEVEFMRKALLETFKTVELREGKTLPSKRITFTMIISLKEKKAHADKP